VWTGATLVNEAMVRDGWAVRYTVPPDVKYADRIERAQSAARARRAGLWSGRGFECLPRDYRRRVCLGSK
jgi:micrococcal nuclease